MMMKPRAYHNLIQEIQLITPTEVGQTVVMPLQTYVRRASDFKKELQDKANIGGAVHHMALTSFAECPDSMMENPLKPPCRMKPMAHFDINISTSIESWQALGLRSRPWASLADLRSRPCSKQPPTVSAQRWEPSDRQRLGKVADGTTAIFYMIVPNHLEGPEVWKVFLTKQIEEMLRIPNLSSTSHLFNSNLWQLPAAITKPPQELAKPTTIVCHLRRPSPSL